MTAVTEASSSASWQPAISQIVKVVADGKYRDFSDEVGEWQASLMVF